MIANQKMSTKIIEALLAHPERLTRVEFDRIVMHLRMVYGNVTGVPILAKTSTNGNNLYEAGLLGELLVAPAIFHAQVCVAFCLLELFVGHALSLQAAVFTTITTTTANTRSTGRICS